MGNGGIRNLAVRAVSVLAVGLLLFGVGAVTLPAGRDVPGSPTVARAASGRWIQQGRWWYRHGDGSFTKNGWEKIGGRWYLFDGAGWMRTGWAKVAGCWYYLDGSGAMATGWRRSGGRWYYFDGSGAMAKGWRKVDYRWYWLRPAADASGPEGAMATGWLKTGGKWYWLDRSSGFMQWNEWIDGTYWVGDDGAMVTRDWVDNGWYYVDGNGVWVRGPLLGDFAPNIPWKDIDTWDGNTVSTPQGELANNVPYTDLTGHRTEYRRGSGVRIVRVKAPRDEEHYVPECSHDGCTAFFPSLDKNSDFIMACFKAQDYGAQLPSDLECGLHGTWYYNYEWYFEVDAQGRTWVDLAIPRIEAAKLASDKMYRQHHVAVGSDGKPAFDDLLSFVAQKPSEDGHSGSLWTNRYGDHNGDGKVVWVQDASAYTVPYYQRDLVVRGYGHWE